MQVQLWTYCSILIGPLPNEACESGETDRVFFSRLHGLPLRLSRARLTNLKVAHCGDFHAQNAPPLAWSASPGSAEWPAGRTSSSCSSHASHLAMTRYIHSPCPPSSLALNSGLLSAKEIIPRV